MEKQMSLDMSGVDPVRWAEIRARVAAIQSFLSIAAPTDEDRLAHAARIGLHKTQFLRLVRVWQTYGTAVSLDSARRERKAKRSDLRRLPDIVDRTMTETLERLGPDTRPRDALAAVNAVMAANGLNSPSTITIKRKLTAIRQARGSVTGWGDVIVAECRVRLPVRTGDSIFMPRLLIAARTSDGSVVEAVLGLDARCAERLGHAVRQAEGGALVTIDEKHAEAYGGRQDLLRPVSMGIACRILARTIGDGFGRLRLQYNASRTPAERLLKTSEDQPLSIGDAEVVIDEAIGRHNAARGRPGGVSLLRRYRDSATS